MTLKIDPETERLIEREIKAGRFPDAAAFVGTAVRHFLITREDLGYSRSEIDALIAEAVASLERGEGVDGEGFFEDLEREENGSQRPRG